MVSRCQTNCCWREIVVFPTDCFISCGSLCSVAHYTDILFLCVTVVDMHVGHIYNVCVACNPNSSILSRPKAFHISAACSDVGGSDRQSVYPRIQSAHSERNEPDVTNGRHLCTPPFNESQLHQSSLQKSRTISAKGMAPPPHSNCRLVSMVLSC